MSEKLAFKFIYLAHSPTVTSFPCSHSDFLCSGLPSQAAPLQRCPHHPAQASHLILTPWRGHALHPILFSILCCPLQMPPQPPLASVTPLWATRTPSLGIDICPALSH